MPENKLVSIAEVRGKRLELFDNGKAPELFVDGIQGLMGGPSIIKWNFFTTGFREGYDGQEKEFREVAARIVCTPEVFVSMVEFLQEVADEIKKNANGETSQSTGTEE